MSTTLTREAVPTIKRIQAEIAGLTPGEVIDAQSELQGRIQAREHTFWANGHEVSFVVGYEDPDELDNPGKVTGGIILAPGVSLEKIREYARIQGQKSRVAFGENALGRKAATSFDFGRTDIPEDLERAVLRGIIIGHYQLGIELGNGSGLHRLGPDRNGTSRRMDMIAEEIESVYGVSSDQARGSVTGKSLESGGHPKRPDSTGFVAARVGDVVLSWLGYHPETPVPTFLQGYGNANKPFDVRMSQLRPGYFPIVLSDGTAIIKFDKPTMDSDRLWELMHEGEANLGLYSVAEEEITAMGGRFLDTNGVYRALREVQMSVPGARHGLMTEELLSQMPNLRVNVSVANAPFRDSSTRTAFELAGVQLSRDFATNFGGILISEAEANNPNGETETQAQRDLTQAEDRGARIARQICSIADEYDIPYGQAADALSLKLDVESLNA